jgi:hypothetical protein
VIFFVNGTSTDFNEDPTNLFADLTIFQMGSGTGTVYTQGVYFAS